MTAEPCVGAGPRAVPARLAGLPLTPLPGGLGLVQASTMLARARGLGGLAHLDPGLGLEISTSSIHTLTMRFDLDLIWRDGDGRVLRLDRSVPRRRMRSCRGARTCIETVAGQGDAFLAALRRR